MGSTLPLMNKKYHFRFEGVGYDIIYYPDGMMQSECTNADLEHHPSRIGQIKTLKVNRFEIANNVWCVYWATPYINLVYIEDFNKMSVNAIITQSDLKQIRQTGVIIDPEETK